MKKYDVIVIGGGFAGLSCSICLQQKGISCLIIEKNKNLLGKVCGDALTVSALNYLKSIGIDPTVVEGKKVFSKIIYKDGGYQELFFSDLFGNDFEYGVSRDDLIEYMLNHTLKIGTEIVWNHQCQDIIHRNDGYCVDGMYHANEIVFANGALGSRLIGRKIPSDLPIGMSARIKGQCTYSDKSFHYFYNECFGSGYGWVFPIGNGIWNIGIYGCEYRNLRQLYCDFEKEIFGSNFYFEYLRKPKGALIGATKEVIRNTYPFWIIGDCAFSANYESGEGISFAIRDGIKTAHRIIEKK